MGHGAQNHQANKFIRRPKGGNGPEIEEEGKTTEKQMKKKVNSKEKARQGDRETEPKGFSITEQSQVHQSGVL